MLCSWSQLATYRASLVHSSNISTNYSIEKHAVPLSVVALVSTQFPSSTFVTPLTTHSGKQLQLAWALALEPPQSAATAGDGYQLRPCCCCRRYRRARGDVYGLHQGQAQLKSGQLVFEQQLRADHLVLEQQLRCLATVIKEQNLGIKALIEEQYKVFHAKLDLLEEKMDLLEEKMVLKLNNVQSQPSDRL
jgi:hypothetical protein